MRTSTRIRTTTAAAVCLAVALALGAPGVGGAASDKPGRDKPGRDEAGRYSFAVIGDVPYGPAQLEVFPEWIAEISAAEPRLAVHVGDIKSGSTPCDTSYYERVRNDLDAFEGPLHLTPGDNEWTDCHRPTNGAYNPLERLAALRSVFFADPSRSLGADPVRVDSQVARGLPENVSFRRQRVAFALLHVVGSNNGRAPWTGSTAPTAEQLAEEGARMDGALDLLRDSFADARQRRSRAVAVFLQADMFDPGYEPDPEDISAFRPLVQSLVDEASTYAGEVYLVNGDSHTYRVDRPLSATAPTDWLQEYDVTGSAENLTRITVDGSTNATNWLRMTIGRGRSEPVLTWERVPLTAVP